MLSRLIPWKYIVRRLATGHGFIDPLALLAAMDRLGQPADFSAPIELLRSGALFHARGILNARAIQYNLDWVWPYWARRQFDPTDAAFLPRAFAFSVTNLTWRNWTAVGLPGCRAYPIVDPRGLLTPFFDGWSLDAWILTEEEAALLPSQLNEVEQNWVLDGDDLRVVTKCREGGFALDTTVRVVERDGAPFCEARFTAGSDRPAWLAIALRPFNPEGVSFIRKLEISSDSRAWEINGSSCIDLQEAPDRHITSEYTQGDVFLRALKRADSQSVACKAGLASAAALYEVSPDSAKEVALSVDLREDKESAPLCPRGELESWSGALETTAGAQLPDKRFQFLYEAALRTLVLLSPQDIYPGPFLYKRFWFRDAVLIMHSMLCAGLFERARRCIEEFEPRQRHSGFFHSQQGEWDSNGQVLWVLKRFCELTGCVPETGWRRMVEKGAEWIGKKRVQSKPDVLHDGLLPAGFSAEHLGNNDFYYWDDFWAIAGLKAASQMMEEWQEEERALAFENWAAQITAAIERSLDRSRDIRQHPGVPASPYRRMDAGAIGSIVASYPLALWKPDDPRMLGTVNYLIQECFQQGAFFQDMAHSGLNPYLTLQVAQVLLRAGDPRAFRLVRTVAELASPTGQWPEAIHPHTGGGCMGDGQHAWASAEWVMMIRNMFLREEGDRLLLGSGIPEEWLQQEGTFCFGPAPTAFGMVTIEVTPGRETSHLAWQGDWRDGPPRIEARLPDAEAVVVDGGERNEVDLRRGEAS